MPKPEERGRGGDFRKVIGIPFLIVELCLEFHLGHSSKPHQVGARSLTLFKQANYHAHGRPRPEGYDLMESVRLAGLLARVAGPAIDCSVSPYWGCSVVGVSELLSLLWGKPSPLPRGFPSVLALFEIALRNLGKVSGLWKMLTTMTTKKNERMVRIPGFCLEWTLATTWRKTMWKRRTLKEPTSPAQPLNPYQRS